MTAAPNPIDGAMIQSDGTLQPMGADDASSEQTRPDDMMPAPVPLAMTNGRQMSAARS